MDGEFNHPNSIAVASDGSVYVSGAAFIVPYRADIPPVVRMQKFTSEGVFVSKWGSYGTGDGQFHGTDGVAVASDGQCLRCGHR